MPPVYAKVDLVVVRENTEGMYTGYELEMGTEAVRELIAFIAETTGRGAREDSGISVQEISTTGAERIVRFAFRRRAPSAVRRSRPVTRPPS